MTQDNKANNISPTEFEIKPVAPDKVERNWMSVKVDYGVLVNMLSIGMNRSDCAFAFGCSVEALEIRVGEDFKTRGYTFSDLERWYRGMYIRQVVLKGQVRAAEAGEWKALEWLGKNYLGQSADGIKGVGRISGASVEDLIKIATRTDERSKYAVVREGKWASGGDKNKQ